MMQSSTPQKKSPKWPISLGKCFQHHSVQSLLCLTLVTPWTVARQAPVSMGILQARILEWVVMPFSR